MAEQAGQVTGLRIFLLGSPRLLRTDGAVHALERKDAALLAMLAVDGPTHWAKAAHLLWPDLSEKQARSNLRQRLFRLRQAARREVVGSSGMLRLLDDVTLDLADIARQLIADPAAAQGELLGNHDYSDNDALDLWARHAREQWRSTRLNMLAQVASDLESNQQVAAALPYAERMVADDPLLEHAHRRVMRLHYLRGDRAAALAAYERCREVLGRELGLRAAGETVQLARLIEASAALPGPAPALRPIATLRPPRLIGREAEWREIGQALRGGSAVLLTGEPGVGKSRLLQEYAGGHGAAASAGARPGDERVAHALLARVLNDAMQRFGAPLPDWVRAELSRLLPELGAAPAGTLDPLRLRQALGHALEAWRAAGLLLIVLDDLQFADDATLELLPALASAGTGLGWLLASRDSELPPAVTRWADSGAVTRLRIAPLDAPSVALLLDSLAIEGLASAAWAGPLTRHTGGNPLFVLETLIALCDRGRDELRQRPASLPVPEHVSTLIERRLAQLSPAGLRLARLAALAGVDFTAELAASVLQAQLLDIADSWRELEQALVIRNEGFAHDLIREATLHTIPASIARELHSQLAALLEQRAAEPARVAQHWFEAGCWARAGASFMKAAQRARQASQRRLEAELAARAAECFIGADDSAGHFAAREQHLHASRYGDPLDVQVRNAEQLMRLATSVDQRGAALEAYAAVLIEDFRDEAIRAAANEARAIAASSGNVARELAAAPIEARALSRMNRIDEALQLVAHYLPRARAHAGSAFGARLFAEFGCVLMTSDRVDEAEPLFRAALAMAQTNDDWGLLQDCHQHLAWVHDYRGDIVASVRSYEAARGLAPRLGSERLASPIAGAILARRYKELGRYSEALALLDEVLREQRRPNIAVIGVAEADEAGVYLWLGQPARALQSLRTPAADAPAAMQRCHSLALAQIEAAQNRPALARLDAARRFAEREGGVVYRLGIDCERSRHLEADAAATLALDGQRRATALGLELMAWPLRLAACDAQRRAGRSAEAADHARACAAHFEQRAPAVVYAPQAWWTVHCALADAGDHGAARVAFERARAWIHDTALPNVPAEFRDSFLNRNPINRQLLTTAARGLPH